MIRDRGIRFAAVVALLLIVSVAGRAGDDAPTLLTVGHVGHDHQIALFVAAERGEALRKEAGGVWFRVKKPREVYDLMRGDAVVAQVNLRKVGGGANMPAALARGEIEVGLGGVAATVAAIDRGADFRIVLGCNSDGDMLMVRPDLPVDSWESFLADVRDADAPVRIGYKAPRAVAYLIFMAALDASGITYGPKAVREDGTRAQVVLVNLNKGANMVPSLEGKVVDGIVMNQPVV
ncbi:MAG: ABC transporter substrate-binding protein, partial [Planctomycetota bacterium]